MREFTPVPKPEPKRKVQKTHIAKRSTKRAKQEREYSKLRKEYLSNHLYCEGNLTGCTTVAVSIQHSRGRVGELLTDVRYFKASCNNCNLRAETHPHEAIANNFSYSRLHE
jgi:hypothetical protein